MIQNRSKKNKFFWVGTLTVAFFSEFIYTGGTVRAKPISAKKTT